MSETKTGISCFKCEKLGISCAAMRIPSKNCFTPKKQTKKRGQDMVKSRTSTKTFMRQSKYAVVVKANERFKPEFERAVLAAIERELSFVDEFIISKEGDLIVRETHGDIYQVRRAYKYIGIGIKIANSK